MGDPNLKSTVDYSRSKSTFSRTKSVDELNETAESICNLEFKLSNKKNSCSSTSYLNEDDDYDYQSNKLDQFNKYKSNHKSMENIGSYEKNSSGVNEEAISEALNAPSEFDSYSENDSSAMNSMDNLFAIHECDERIMPNQFESDKCKIFYYYFKKEVNLIKSLLINNFIQIFIEI